ncbi:MAG: DUF3035 domain-containing protein [Paracoccaceae bacterium]
MAAKRKICCRIGALLAVTLLISACSDRESRLSNPGTSSNGPDEFSILPGKPLQTPASYTELPAPTPGAENLTDPTPKADAVAALGGNRDFAGRPGIPAADGPLLTYASRHGVQANVRAELAAADLAFRRRRTSIFSIRWFGGNRYFAAYRNQALDPYLALERLRAAGVKTPSAPPRPGR